MTEGENGEGLDPGVGEHVLMGLAGTEIRRTEDSILERTMTQDLDPGAGELVLMGLDEVEKEKTGDRILETEKAMNLLVEAQAYMWQRAKSA